MKYKPNKPKIFYLHFNRIAMQRGDPKVWTVRTSKGCLHAKEVLLDVPVVTIFKPGSAQPRAFFKGYGYGYWIDTKKDCRLWITNHIQG